MSAVEPWHCASTDVAPACSVAVMNGSTSLIASTRPAASAAGMAGNGISTYLIVAGLIPSSLSTALRVRVWMLPGRLTAMLLPARLAGPVMFDLGRARTFSVFPAHWLAAARTLILITPLLAAWKNDT